MEKMILILKSTFVCVFRIEHIYTKFGGKEKEAFVSLSCACERQHKHISKFPSH